MSYTDVAGTTTATSYDQAGRVIQTITTTHTATDGSGAVLNTSTQGWTYLDDGQVTTVTLDGLTLAQVGYNTAGEVNAVAYPAPTGTGSTTGGDGVISGISRDSAGRQTQVRYLLPNGTTIQDAVTYSQAGRVMSDTTATVTGSTTTPVSSWSYRHGSPARSWQRVAAPLR